MMNSLFDLTGRTALVTGGNGGLGLGFARGLAEVGASVVIAARDADKNAAAVEQIQASGGTATAVVCDVGDGASIDAAVRVAGETYGGLDVLVANAGVGRPTPVPVETDESWNQVIDTNLTGVFRTCRSAYPLLKESPAASVICVSSVLAHFGELMMASYSASKGGVSALVRSLAVEWARDGIRVNTVVPGLFFTEMNSVLKAPEMADRLAAIEARIPLGGGAEPGELAGSVVFLAAQVSARITGQELVVDSGYSVLA